MVKVTTIEFNELREGIAGAHLFVQAMHRLLKARHTMLNKDQRNLLAVVPESVQHAFTLISQISQREQGNPNDPENTPTVRITDLDTRTMRDEIENVSALSMPDLVHEMCCAINELPGLNVLSSKPDSPPNAEGVMCAIVWEAGRRYGIQQAMAIFDNTSADFVEGSGKALQFALDSALDLPAPELPLQPGRVVPFECKTADAAASGDARSTDTEPLTIREVEPSETVN